MICQNQSIDDSDAPLARDLRLLVRERIASGESDTQVIDFLVARYGSFVLLKPRFELQTLALWMLPPFALLIGALVLFLQARRRRLSSLTAAQNAPPLSAAEQAELQRVLNGSEPVAQADPADNRSITKD
jgi:cytochrome c-type biogenesis protein CcmH